RPLALLLSLWPRTRRDDLGAAGARRPPLVQGRCRVPDQGPGARRILEEPLSRRADPHGPGDRHLLCHSLPEAGHAAAPEAEGHRHRRGEEARRDEARREEVAQKSSESPTLKPRPSITETSTAGGEPAIPWPTRPVPQ